MKKYFLKTVLYTSMVCATLTSCNNSAEKVENAEKKVTDANEELDQAKKEQLGEIENYRKLTAEKITANNKSITEFRARVEAEKLQAKADYQKKITELEQKNSDLKKKMDDFKSEGKDEWTKFKTEFDRDMDVLVQALKDFYSPAVVK